MGFAQKDKLSSPLGRFAEKKFCFRPYFNPPMKKSAQLVCLTIILTGNLLHSQVLSNADRAKERYQQRVATAEKIKTDGIAKLELVYNAEVKLAQDEVKRSFEPLIRAAALRNQTEEVRTLTLQMESIVNPDGVIMPDQVSETPNGTDYKQLIGTWETSDSMNGYSRSFEFKSSRTVFYTYTYSSTGGEKGSQTEEWRATTKPDKIVIERKDSRSHSYSFKEWYEIKIPFETDSVEITRFSESDGRSSNSSFRLTRKQ